MYCTVDVYDVWAVCILYFAERPKHTYDCMISQTQASLTYQIMVSVFTTARVPNRQTAWMKWWNQTSMEWDIRHGLHPETAAMPVDQAMQMTVFGPKVSLSTLFGFVHSIFKCITLWNSATLIGRMQSLSLRSYCICNCVCDPFHNAMLPMLCVAFQNVARLRHNLIRSLQVLVQVRTLPTASRRIPLSNNKMRAYSATELTPRNRVVWLHACLSTTISYFQFELASMCCVVFNLIRFCFSQLSHLQSAWQSNRMCSGSIPAS